MNDADRSVSDPEMDLEKTPQKAFLRYKRKKTTEYNSDLSSFKEEIKIMLRNQDQELRKIFTTIQQSNVNILSSVALLTTQNEEYKKKIEQLEAKIQEDKKYMAVLENRIEDMQIGIRKTNFEIKNVPKKATETREDLVGMVMSLSKNIGGDIRKDDIKDIYRVRGKKDGSQNTPIIVETSSTMLKTDTLKLSKAFNIKHKTKLRALHLGFRTSEDTPIYVAEQLTPKGSRLHFLARDLAKSKQYKFCWTAYGKVYVRKDENTAIITIKTEAQVQQLLQEK